MDNNIFYGTDKNTAITYLEFGEIDLLKGKKKIWEFQLHQKAYDWLMLSRYVNDLQAFITMNKLIEKGSTEEIIKIYNEEIHHQDEASLNLTKLIAMAITQNNDIPGSFYELGQTIFGCIEGIDFYQNLIERLGLSWKKLGLKKIEWYGVDISKMFNDLSVTFHPEYKIHTMCDPNGLPAEIDVFFSKGITLLYAVRSIKQFFETIGNSRCAVFDYSFSMDKSEETTIGSGKTVYYIEWDKFIKEYEKQNKVMFINTKNSKIVRETNRIWLDCLYATEKDCKKYIDIDQRVRKGIFQKLGFLNNSKKFLHGDGSPDWIRVEEVIKDLNRVS